MFTGKAILKPASGPVLANLVAWWQGDNYTAGNWPDSSGNGNTATQATAGQRPSLVTNALNGHSVAVCASGQWLACSTVGLIGDFTASIFIVVNPSQVSSGTAPICLGSNGSSGGGFALFSAFRGSGVPSVELFGNAPVTFQTIATGFQIFTIEKTPGNSGATTSLWRNGAKQTVQGSPTNAVPNVGNFLSIGAALEADHTTILTPFTGQIAEILIYNVALNSTDRAKDELYLKNKYGL